MRNLAKKILSVENLPEGSLDRYIRDVHAGSDTTKPFELFKKEWENRYAMECEIRDKSHPIEYNKTFQLSVGPLYKHTVTLFKRKGEDWICGECDLAPNGGGGTISLEHALILINDVRIVEEVKNV